MQSQNLLFLCSIVPYCAGHMVRNLLTSYQEFCKVHDGISKFHIQIFGEWQSLSKWKSSLSWKQEFVLGTPGIPMSLAVTISSFWFPHNLKVLNENCTHLIHPWTSPGPCLRTGKKPGSHLLPRSLPEHSTPQTNSLCGGWVGGRSMLGRKWVSLFNLCRCNTLFKDKTFLSI